ncbi:hypothetical protein BLA29_007620, partial [Euroglyphus maynei]
MLEDNNRLSSPGDAAGSRAPPIMASQSVDEYSTGLIDPGNLALMMERSSLENLPFPSTGLTPQFYLNSLSSATATSNQQQQQQQQIPCGNNSTSNASWKQDDYCSDSGSGANSRRDSTR